MSEVYPQTHFLSKIRQGEFVYFGEIEYTPSLALSTFDEQIAALPPQISGLTVPDNPGANIFLDNLVIAQYLFPKISHDLIVSVNCRDYNRIALGSRVVTALSLGIRNLLLVSGDHTSLGSVPASKPVNDLDSTQLLQLCRIFEKDSTIFDNLFDFSSHPSQTNFINSHPSNHLVLGAVVNVNSTSPEIELAKIHRKQQFQLDFLQTQVIFELDTAESFLTNLRSENIPIIGGIAPMNDYGLAKKVAAFLPGVQFPKALLAQYRDIQNNSDNHTELQKAYNKVNLAYYEPTIRELRKKHLIQGLYFATMNYSDFIPHMLIAMDGRTMNYR